MDDNKVGRNIEEEQEQDKVRTFEADNQLTSYLYIITILLNNTATVDTKPMIHQDLI